MHNFNAKNNYFKEGFFEKSLIDYDPELGKIIGEARYYYTPDKIESVCVHIIKYFHIF